MQPLIASEQIQTLPVRVLVLTRHDGSGNPLWTRGYVAELLDQASAEVGQVVAFTLASYETVAESHLYSLDQAGVLAYAMTEATPGRLTVVISRPDTEDSAGQSLQAVAPGRRLPVFTMRARIQDWSGIQPTASIFLHELGHQMGLQHKPEPFLDDGQPTTDDYFWREDGLALLARYAALVTTR